VILSHDVTKGPDGNVWYAAQVFNRKTGVEAGEIGRVTPSGEVKTFRLPLPPKSTGKRVSGSFQPKGGLLADSVTAGPDGNVWFTDHQTNGVSAVGKITPTGKITQYAIPTTPKNAKVPAIATSIAEGPDGNLWFNLSTDDFLNGPVAGPYIGRAEPTGRVVVFVLPSSTDSQGALLAEGAESITPGPGGKVWFASVSRRYVSSSGRVLASFTPPKS
jgi:virginiamycin B lyase